MNQFSTIMITSLAGRKFCFTNVKWNVKYFGKYSTEIGKIIANIKKYMNEIGIRLFNFGF